MIWFSNVIGLSFITFIEIIYIFIKTYFKKQNQSVSLERNYSLENNLQIEELNDDTINENELNNLSDKIDQMDSNTYFVVSSCCK